jgi:Na+/phosphate symporter
MLNSSKVSVQTPDKYELLMSDSDITQIAERYVSYDYAKVIHEELANSDSMYKALEKMYDMLDNEIRQDTLNLGDNEKAKEFLETLFGMVAHEL